MLFTNKHAIQKVYKDTSLFSHGLRQARYTTCLRQTCSVQRKQCPIAHGTGGFCYQTSEYSLKFFGGEFKWKMHCNQCSSKNFFQAGWNDFWARTHWLHLAWNMATCKADFLSVCTLCYVLEDLRETMLTTCVLLTMSKTPAPANIQAKLCETQTYHTINRELNQPTFLKC